MESKVIVQPSLIHGVGLFTTQYIFMYNYIFTAIKNNQITELGSKINHSYTPNCILIRNGDDYEIYSKRNISTNTEITVDYTFTPDFIKKPHQYHEPLR